MGERAIVAWQLPKKIIPAAQEKNRGKKPVPASYEKEIDMISCQE